MFCGHGILNMLEMLMEDQNHRPPKRRIAVEGAGFMFGNPRFKLATRCADIVRAVGAADDIDEMHGGEL